MKHLYLIRHAKSSWSDPTASDFERKLNKRGKRDAPFMGSRLAKYEIIPDAIYASPAKRARKTALAVAKKIGFPQGNITFDDTLYTFTIAELFGVVQNISDKENVVFIVGHNYAITDLAVTLTGASIENVPTAGIVGIDLKITSWKDVSPGTCKLLFFDYPKKHGGRS